MPNRLEQGRIEHQSMSDTRSWDFALDIILKTERPSRLIGRRMFLQAMGAGVASLALSGVSNSKIFTEREMDEFDIRGKYVIERDGGEEMFLGEFENKNKPSEAEIRRYIEIIVARSASSKLGVHMQQHENVMWLIAYFNHKKEADQRVLYHPAKVGVNSMFVAKFLKESRDKKLKIDTHEIKDPYSNNTRRKVDVYLKEGETLEKLSKPRGAHAFIDTGWAYVILPADTNIIKSGDKMFIAACRNPILSLLSECPDPK